MAQPDPRTATSLFQFQAQTLDGRPQPLSEYAGKVVLVVNTASKCGFTPQFKGLQRLYERFGEQGFVVLGFPSAQFKQELASDDKVGSFCQRNYGVEFPMFATTDVNGADAHPVFQWLKERQPGGIGKVLGGKLGSAEIKWNFTKFLVDRNGHVVGRYAPATTPDKIVADIERALAEKA